MKTYPILITFFTICATCLGQCDYLEVHQVTNLIACNEVFLQKLEDPDTLIYGMVLEQDIPIPDEESCREFQKEFHEILNWSDTNCIIFRFIYSRAFDNPFMFRIQKCNEEIKLVTKKFNYDYQHNEQWPGKILESHELILNTSDWYAFINLIKKSTFWEMPSKILDYGMDGSDWDIQGFENRKYHLVTRWCAKTNAERNELPKAKEFYDCCKYLIDLSKIKIDKIY